MRISFGGGRGRGPYHPRISFELGPVGGCIVSVLLMMFGAFMILISFGNMISIIVGALVIALGVWQFKVNKSKISGSKKDEEE